jgi:hypothetical protein
VAEVARALGMTTLLSLVGMAGLLVETAWAWTTALVGTVPLRVRLALGHASFKLQIAAVLGLIIWVVKALALEVEEGTTVGEAVTREAEADPALSIRQAGVFNTHRELVWGMAQYLLYLAALFRKVRLPSLFPQHIQAGRAQCPVLFKQDLLRPNVHL